MVKTFDISNFIDYLISEISLLKIFKVYDIWLQRYRDLKSEFVAKTVLIKIKDFIWVSNL